MSPRRPPINVAKLPNGAVNVGDGYVLDRRINLVVEWRENRIGAEPRDGKSPTVIRIRRRQNLSKSHNVVLLNVANAEASWLLFLLLFEEVSRRFESGYWIKNDFGEDLVGYRVGEELDVSDEARDERFRDGEGNRRAGLLHVPLREVVYPRIDGGNLDGGARTSAPDAGVHGAWLGGRVRLLRRHFLGFRWKRYTLWRVFFFSQRDFFFLGYRDIASLSLSLRLACCMSIVYSVGASV